MKMRVVKNLPLMMIGCYLLILHAHLTVANAEVEPGTEEPRVDDRYDELRKLGDFCMSDHDCQVILNGECNLLTRTCECKDSHPVPIWINSCYEEIPLNHSCVHDSQCAAANSQSHCSKYRCECKLGFHMKHDKNGTAYCAAVETRRLPEPGSAVDYTLLGILIGMAAMFVVMCVVLRMFSKARFQDQRTIFNSPRLLKVSLARKSREDSERRGSRCSNASRPPSVYSGLNIPGKSPTGSQTSVCRSNAGSRRGSVQTPLDDRRFPPTRNADHVTVDIRGSKESSGPKVNRV